MLPYDCNQEALPHELNRIDKVADYGLTKGKISNIREYDVRSQSNIKVLGHNHIYGAHEVKINILYIVMIIPLYKAQ